MPPSILSIGEWESTNGLCIKIIEKTEFTYDVNVSEFYLTQLESRLPEEVNVRRVKSLLTYEMSLFHPRTVRSSLWPSLTLSWFFGGANVRVNRGWRILYSTAASSVFVFFHAYTLVWINETRTTSTKIFQLVTDLVEYLRIWSILAVIWSWEFRGSRVLEKAIDELRKVDDGLKNFGLEVNYRKFVIKQLITASGFLILAILSEELKERSVFWNRENEASPDVWERLTVTVFFNAQFFQSTIADLVLTAMLDSFYVRFKLLNELLEQISGSKNLVINVRIFETSCYRDLDSMSEGKPRKLRGNRASNGNSYLIMRRVDEIFELYRDLLKEAENLRDSFSLQLSVSFANLFILSLQKVFELFLLYKTNRMSVLTICGNTIAIIFVSIRFWQVILSCSKVSDQVAELGISLYRIPIQNEAVHNQLKKYSASIIQRQLTFTAGEIFTINRGLALSIFSNFFTYLMILIQLRNSYRK